MTNEEIQADKLERYYSLQRKIVALNRQNLLHPVNSRSRQIQCLCDAAECLRLDLLKQGIVVQ